MYKLEFLPVARQDMIEIVRYISVDLGNPDAATQLANEMITASERILDMPYAHSSYIPIRPLKHEYRKMLVKNYLLLYWVNEQNKTVTIVRVIYVKRDYTRLLE